MLCRRFRWAWPRILHASRTSLGLPFSSKTPAALTTESRRLSRTYYPVDAQTRKLMAGVDGVTTPFVLFRGYYDAACMTSPEGYRYLGISAAAAPGEKRVAPVDLEDRRLNRSFGTHVLDMQFTQGDLVDLVGKRIGQ